jgi:hypothetical protein
MVSVSRRADRLATVSTCYGNAAVCILIQNVACGGKVETNTCYNRLRKALKLLEVIGFAGVFSTSR